MSFIESQCSVLSLGSANQLVNSFIASILALHCNITNPNIWPDDYGREASKNGFPQYDFIVIGAGTAGSVVAARLAENPEDRVLLLEAGGDPPLESEIPGLTLDVLGTKYDWKYKTQPNGHTCLANEDESCTWNKGKMLGGSSSINGTNYFRGIPYDYDRWESQGNVHWGYYYVLPYFKKSEDFSGPDSFNVHGKGGPISVEPFRTLKFDQEILLAAAKELNYSFVRDFAEQDIKGFGYIHGTVKNGRRVSTAKGFLTHKKPNLHVVKNAVANRINFDGNKNTNSVSFAYGGKQYNVTVKKEVILSAGSIESPKLLMLSGIGPPTHLHAMGIPIVSDVPAGNNLQDHVSTSIFMRVQLKNSTEPETELLDAIYEQWVHRTGSFGSIGLNIAVFTNTNKSSQIPDIMFMWRPLTNITGGFGRYKEIIRKSILRQVGPYDRIYAVGVVLMRPESTGFVRLKSLNYKDDPEIIPNYFQNDKDAITMAHGLQELTEFEKTDTMRRINGQILRLDLPACDSNPYGSIRYWVCYSKYMCGTYFHAAGTTKMGPSFDPTAVVDPELRVRGVKGLRVVDASIIPSMITGHINSPVTMIAERGADFVKNSWRKDIAK